MDNLHYFKISRDNPEPLIDSAYQKDCKTVIPSKASKKNSLTESNARLTGLITDFSKIQGNPSKKKERSEIIKEIVDILTTVEHINFSPFAQFFMTYNINIGMLKGRPQEEQMSTVEEILSHFCKTRHQIYLDHGYSDIILQVMADNYSHKRNSKAGIEKVEKILAKHGFKKKKNIENFHKKFSEKFYFLPDKDGKEAFKNFRTSLNIAMESNKDDIEKLPDIVFHISGHFYIMELKNMKQGGGGQDKQIIELAHFIHYSEKDAHFHYISYLDGLYSNVIFSERLPSSPEKKANDKTKKPKKKTDQRQAFQKNLEANPQNYFVNTAGFDVLLADLCEGR